MLYHNIGPNSWSCPFLGVCMGVARPDALSIQLRDVVTELFEHWVAGNSSKQPLQNLQQSGLPPETGSIALPPRVQEPLLGYSISL